MCYKQLLESWKISSAFQLLLPNPEGVKVELGKESGRLASIVYLAWKRGYLSRIDGVIDEFQIISKGTDVFKGALKENWLEKKEGRRRNISNQTMAALSELFVAHHLKKSGHIILDLEAWKQNRSDKISTIDVLSCQKDEKLYHEVKYLSDSPEWYEQRVKAAKGNGFASSWLPSSGETLNYFYYRLAEATLQLGKVDCQLESKKAWFVFDESNEEREEFEEDLKNGSTAKWYSVKGDHPCVLEKKKDLILSLPPSEWLKRIHSITLATLSKFELIDISEFQF